MMNRSRILVKLFMTIAVVFMIVPVSIAYNHVALSQSDLPYSAQSNDSITFIGDTLYVTSGTPIYVDNHNVNYNIILVHRKQNVFINFDNTVIFINTAGNVNSRYEVGILVTGFSSDPSDGVIIQGPGKIIRDIAPGSESGSGHIGINIFIARNVTINDIDITIDGMNSKCVSNIRVYRGIEFNGGRWTNNSNTFSDRQYFESVAYTCSRVMESVGPGEFNVTFDGVTVVKTPHAGLYIAKAKVKIVNCTLSVDAQNVLYDTLNCFPGGCGVGNSAANAYNIVLHDVQAGSLIRNNVITTGVEHQGGRGILVENVAGTASEPVIIDSNFVEVFNGPDGENKDGVVRVLRLRSLDGGHWDYIEIRDNIFVGIVDDNPATTAIGKSCSVLQCGNDDSDIGYSNLILERNTVIARALTTGAVARAAELGIEDSWRLLSGVPWTIRNNHYISSGTIVKTGDIYNAKSANHLLFEGDTLSVLDINSDSGVVDNPVTWSIGYYLVPSIDMKARDCIYLNGASDTNIVLYNQNSHEFLLERTINIAPLGDNGLWINGATVTVTNAYGQTVMSGTSSNGRLTGVVSYWYVQTGSSDSLGFNPFFVSVSKDGVTKDSSVVVAWDKNRFEIRLAGLTGTVIPDQDPLSNLGNFTSTILAVDFSGENDSIQVGFTSGSDNVPDSAIFCYSTGSYPDSANSNRVAAVYAPNSIFDFDIVASVDEPDTLYFSFWTKTNADFWSDRSLSKLYIGDYSPPAAIDSTFAVPGTQKGELDFSWKATGDDGTIGTATSVIIKYSTSPVNSSNWNAAQLFSNPPSPLPSGQFDTIIISNLQVGVIYFVGIKAIDDDGNESPIATASGYSRGIQTPDISADSLITDTVNFMATVFAQTVQSYNSLFYEFELDSDSAYSNPQKVTQTSFDSYASATFTNLSASVIYFWRSRAIASDSSEFSEWSLSRAFILTSGFINLGPTSPTLLSPADFDSLTTTTPAFVWSNSIDPEGDLLTYDIEVYDSNGVTVIGSASGISEGNNDQTSWTIGNGLLIEGNSYTWRVRSFDGDLYSAWTSLNAFAVISLDAGFGDEPFKAYAYPNPASKSSGDFLTFVLPSEPVSLLIQSVSGEKIILKNNLTDQFSWNLRNSSGEIVSAGVYLWYISPNGSKGKIMVKP